MTDTTYNGWTNYETWAVGMYLDGNYTGQGTYELTIETVREALEQSTYNVLTDKKNDRYQVSQALKTFVDEMAIETNDTGVATDLLGAAFDRVDWYELADAWIQNLSEQTV